MTLDINEHTNSELREMGIDFCECLSTYRECDPYGTCYDVCVDCEASAIVPHFGRRGFPW